MSQCLNPDCLRQNPTNPNFCQSCGSRLLLSDRYRAIKIIGRGGFGRTFLALDEQKFKRKCVIKQFLPQDQGTSNVQRASELFLSEAEQLNNLGNHPQIPELLAYFTQDNRQYLVQEFIEGANLAEVLEKDGAFNETQIRNLLTNLLPVFEFIHSRHIIHRDIKPENIIRRTDGQLVLVDFGAAKQTTLSALSVTGTVIGTKGYTSSEQALGKAVAASDIYSLGVTCIHLLTGVVPFELFDTDEGEWIWRNYLKSQVSDELGQILDKMIESAKNRRYQSATEVMKALQPSKELQPSTYHNLIAFPPDSTSSQPIQWLHKRLNENCEGNLQIGDNGKIRCECCHKQMPVLDWYMTDKRHLSDSPLGHKLNEPWAMSFAGQLTPIAGNQWLSQFLEQF